MASGHEEIYRFPAGALRPEHFQAFGEALKRTLPPTGARVSVVLELGSRPAALESLGLQSLGAEAYDDTSDCAVLDYASLEQVIAHLEPLFRDADPALFLARSDSFQDTVARVRAYGELLVERLQARSNRVEPLDITRSELVVAYAPVVMYRADGRCVVVRSSLST